MAKCKNCTKCLMGETVFIHGARVYPFCGVDGEEVENLDEDKECIDFECMTNADRIRSMTDEELIAFIKHPCKTIKEMTYPNRNCVFRCDECIEEWLKEKVE